jgi:glyoxylase-like metal-dependent hydrolase (beta-lactamase superfamily II)
VSTYGSLEELPMKTYAQGVINERIAVAANAMYPAYVLKGNEKNLMIDAGLNLLGPLYLHSINLILGDQNNLDYLCLTHSHYDHLGAMPYLKRKIPGLKVGGSPRISELLKKDTVLIRMGYLSDLQRSAYRDIVGDEDVSFGSVEMDMPLKEGDEIDLGGLTCRVFEVPGHTRDSLAYYVPEYRALFPGEAAGVPEGIDCDSIQTQFLYSFDHYVASLEKMISLEPEIIGVGHGFVLTEKDAMSFLEKSLKSTYEYRKLIEYYIDRVRGNLDRAIELMVEKEYDKKGTIKQERNAYVVNLTAQVKEVIRLNTGRIVKGL